MSSCSVLLVKTRMTYVGPYLTVYIRCSLMGNKLPFINQQGYQTETLKLLTFRTLSLSASENKQMPGPCFLAFFKIPR